MNESGWINSLKACSRPACDELNNLKVLSYIRNDPNSKNKIVKRIQYNDEILILKSVETDSEWVLEQAYKEIEFLEILAGEMNIPKLILQCESETNLRLVFSTIYQAFTTNEIV